MATATAAHLRSSPNPTTPTAPSPLIFSLLGYLTYPYIILVGLPRILAAALSYNLNPHPFPSWTLTKAVSIAYAKVRNGPAGFVLPPLPSSEEEWSPPATPWNTLSAEERAEVELKVVRVDPVSEEYQQRGITVCPGVESVSRPGFWLTPKGSKGKGDEKAKEGEKVILHLHGGGYIRGHPLWLDAPHGMALTLGQRLFSMNYRKCLSSDTAFPAPLLDALAGYIYLTKTLSFPAESITLIGESAGAHLCLILSRYLSDLSLPQPGSIVLVSPWADFTMDPSALHGSYVSYSPYDFILPWRLHMGIRSATRHYTPEAIRGEYFSPALAGAGKWAYLKKEDVRVLVVYGSKELFEDEDKGVVAGMIKDKVDVAVYVDMEGFHTRVSIEPEANKAFKKGLLEWSNQA